MQKAAPRWRRPPRASPKVARPAKAVAPPTEGTDGGSGLDLRWFVPAVLVAVASIVAGVL